MSRLESLVEKHARELHDPLQALSRTAPVVARWAEQMAVCLQRGGKVLTAGNGGSAAQAQHLAAELVGRYREERRGFAAMSLTADGVTVSALVNDYGRDLMFARQVEACARAGDILVLLSTSGRSPNVIAAAQTARCMHVSAWALTGPAPNPLASACEESICIAAATTAAVQEMHLVVLHALCECLDAVVLQAAGV